jgi:osmoprotectant transport system ATP-binding protein
MNEIFLTLAGAVVISFERVTKRFPDGSVAVENLSLEMPAGQITVLVGPSGCGKTTSLRMINRLVDPTEGRILIDGEDTRGINKPGLRRRIGYVIQHAGLLPHRTIVDNVATVPLLLGWGRKRARARAMELLELVGLPGGYAKRYPYQLSGGQQQRVGVARALCADPPIMLMDEPFSAVDPVVRKSLQDEFLRLQQQMGKTIVLVTHDIDEAIKLGDQIAVMRVGGHLAQFDTPAALLGTPADEFVEGFIGVDRGIRRLSFMPAVGLPLSADAVVSAGAGGDKARSTARLIGAEWLLVVDADGHALGWLPSAEIVPESPVDQHRLRPYGHTFRPAADSLRAALDSAVLSPAGQAVGVDDEGRVLGVASHAQVCAAINVTDGERYVGSPQ